MGRPSSNTSAEVVVNIGKSPQGQINPNVLSALTACLHSDRKHRHSVNKNSRQSDPRLMNLFLRLVKPSKESSTAEFAGVHLSQESPWPARESTMSRT